MAKASATGSRGGERLTAAEQKRDYYLAMLARAQQQQRPIILAMCLNLVFVAMLAVAGFWLGHIAEGGGQRQAQQELDFRVQRLEQAQKTLQQQITQFDELAAQLGQSSDGDVKLRLTNLLIDHQKEQLAFIKKLETEMFELTKEVEGSRTWFDQYAERIAVLIDSSYAKLKLLLQLKRLHKPLM